MNCSKNCVAATVSLSLCTGNYLFILHPSKNVYIIKTRVSKLFKHNSTVIQTNVLIAYQVCLINPVPSLFSPERFKLL